MHEQQWSSPKWGVTHKQKCWAMLTDLHQQQLSWTLVNNVQFFVHLLQASLVQLEQRRASCSPHSCF